jgi:hypothetical protein
MSTRCTVPVPMLSALPIFNMPVPAAVEAQQTSTPKSRPLFVKQRLPVWRNRFGRSGHRLIQRMRVRGVKLRAGEELPSTIVVKPSLARLEARDYRVTRSRVMFRCVLIW